MIIPEVLWVSGTAFITSLVLSPIIRDIFHAYNVVDRPDYRKVHAYPIPRLGGLPVGIAYAIALLTAPNVLGQDSLFAKLLPGAGLVLLLGIIDDFFSIPALYKLAGQIAAAAVAFLSGLRIERIGDIPIPYYASFAATVLWLLLLMNAFNLIDGLDGLCGGMGFIGAIALFAAAHIQARASLDHAMLPLAGALLGFLFYNFSRATLFLGDSGALLIGFLVGAGGILLVGQTPSGGAPVNPVVSAMVVAVPLLDVALSISRRFLGKRPIFGADRGHIHHRLLDAGKTARGAVLNLYLWAALGAGFAILLMLGTAPWHALVLFVFLGVIVAGVRALRYPEFSMAAKLLFGEFRTAVQRRERVVILATNLARTKSDEECWDALTAFGSEAGWAELAWIKDGEVTRKKLFADDVPRDWSFRIALAGDDALVVQGTFGSKNPAVDMLDFAHAARESIGTASAAWRR